MEGERWKERGVKSGGREGREGGRGRYMKVARKEVEGGREVEGERGRVEEVEGKGR